MNRRAALLAGSLSIILSIPLGIAIFHGSSETADPPRPVGNASTSATAAIDEPVMKGVAANPVTPTTPLEFLLLHGQRRHGSAEQTSPAQLRSDEPARAGADTDPSGPGSDEIQVPPTDLPAITAPRALSSNTRSTGTPVSTASLRTFAPAARSEPSQTNPIGPPAPR